MKRTLQSHRRQAARPLFTVGAVALIAATYGLARLGYGLFLPAFSSAFALTPAVGGLLASGSSVLYCAAALVGFRCAPGHPQLITLLAGATAALGSAGIAIAPSTSFFLGAVLLAGLGAGFASPALVELVQRNIGAGEQKRLQSVVNSGTGFGVVAAGMLALIFGSSWRLAWALIALVALAAMTTVLCTDTSRTGAISSNSGGSTAPERVPGLRNLRRPAVAAFLFGAGSAAVWVHGRTLLQEQGGLSADSSATAWIALGIGGAAAVLSAPWLARHTIKTTWLLTVLAVAAATGMFTAARANVLLSLGASALFGLTYTAATSVLIIWAGAVATSSTAGTSILFISLVLGQSAGSALTGGLIEAVGFGPAFLLAAGLCAVATFGFPARDRVHPSGPGWLG